MENFVFALNATIPVFMIILLGFFLQKKGLLNDAFNKVANQYVFKIALPVSLFKSIATMDLYTDFSLSFCLFCFFVTTIMFLGVWALTLRFMKDRRLIGAFAQGSVRSSAAILGVALAVNIYGNSGLVPMMIVAAVPFFNVYAVLILSFSPHIDENGHLLPPEATGTAAVRKACRNVMTNPIILGILAGIPFALLRITIPTMFMSAVSNIGGTATPVALLVIGASFSGSEALSRWKPALVGTFIKLILLPAVFLPPAALMGFRGSAMVAILIMVGSPTTAACYVMARSMKNDGTLTSNMIVLTTLLSSVSITLWLAALRSFALI